MRPLSPLFVAAAVLVPASLALAQGGPNPAFMKWREQHKNTFQLRTMLGTGIVECERAQSTEIKPAQAKQLLAIVNPLRKQPKLTQDQAKAAIGKVKKLLDTRQLTAMDKAITDSQRRRGGPGGAPGGGAGGPGGAPGGGAPGGNRPPFDAAKMKDFNPFNPDKSSPMYERTKERNDALFAFLEARSAGKPAKMNFPGRGPR